MSDINIFTRDFRVRRALAIEAYAQVESELCYVLSALIGSTHDIAAIIFFKITSTGARNAIIASLLEHIHGDKFQIYWHGQPGGSGIKKQPGLFNLINQLDGRRSEIIHWHPVSSTRASVEGDEYRWQDLRPAFFWARGNAQPITRDDLADFQRKAEFVEKSLSKFWRFIRYPKKFSADELQTWTQIFQRPAIYPPSENHPLALKPRA